jgi:FtsP/CotA-like multicopper oxidase with cupredoxin domain
VYVEDRDGNIVTSDDSEVTLSIASGPAGTLRGTLTVAAVNGVATFSGLSFSKTGDFTLRASYGGAITSLSDSFAIGAKLVFQRLPATVTAGATIGPGFNVLVEDAGGHILTTDNSAVTLALVSGPGGAVLAGTRTVQAVNGVAAFSDLSIELAGKYKLAATDGYITGATSSTLSIVPAAPIQSQMVFVQDASACIAGVKMNPSLSIEFRDQYGNVAANYRGTVTLSVASGPGVLSGTPSATVKNGFATFSNLTLRTAGSYTLNATNIINGTAGGLHLTSALFTVSPNTAKKLAFAQAPTAAIAGVDIAPAITVDVTDVYGNVITNSTASVTLALQSGPKGGTFTSITAPAVNGVATFGTVALTKAGSYKLKATAASLSAAPSGGFVISPAAASQLVFVAPPKNAVAGAALKPAIVVQIQDQFGNPVTGDTSSVTLAIVSGPSGSTFTGVSTIALHNGLATFSSVSLGMAGPYTIRATDGLLTSPASTSFTIAPAAATQLVIVQQPTNAAVGASITPALTVKLLDSFGNLATNNRSTVSLSIATGPLTTKLSGNSAAVVNGVATFSALKMSAAGTYTLKVADGKLAPVTTDSFTIS